MRNTFFVVLLVFAILNLLATVFSSIIISQTTQSQKSSQEK